MATLLARLDDGRPRGRGVSRVRRRLGLGAAGRESRDPDALSVGSRASDVPEVAESFWRIGEADARMPDRARDARARRCVAGRWTTWPAIDPRSSKTRRRNWRLDRMPVIDRLILRLGIYELLHERRHAAGGRDRRGARAGAALQHRRGRAVRQRRPRRRRRRGLNAARLAREARPHHDVRIDEQISSGRPHLEALGAARRRAPIRNRFDRTHGYQRWSPAHRRADAAKSLEAEKVETRHRGPGSWPSAASARPASSRSPTA